SSSSACRCDALVSGMRSQSNRSSTIMAGNFGPPGFSHKKHFFSVWSPRSPPPGGIGKILVLFLPPLFPGALYIQGKGPVHWRKKAVSSAALHRLDTERLAVVRHSRMLP